MRSEIAAVISASVPKVKTAGVTAIAGTTFDSPSTTRIGDLLIACRGSTGGGIQGMGTDFTSFGSEGTGAYDINCCYRIATANGVTTHTIPSGGATAFWVLIAAGTFNRADPCSGFAGSEQDHNNAVWPSTAFARMRHLAIAGTYNSSAAVIPTRIPGSYPLWTNTGSAPYSRGFAKLGGFPALDLTNTSGDGANGTAGQTCKIWSFAVNPA